MMELFFGDLWAILSTFCLLATLLFIALTAARHKAVEKWGRRVLILALTGLALCCFVVMRDDYAAALQGGAGLFALDSLQIILAYAGAAVVALCALSCALIRRQGYRKVMFFLLAGAILFKAGLIEISRIMMG